MKSLFKRSIVFILAASAVSCVENRKPNYQYMPNMYETVSYEPYGAYDVFVNEQEAKLPADGTVSRGWKPYVYPNTAEGRQAATEQLENPLPFTEDNLATGKALYTVYCAICHGDNGDGQGYLVEREKILGVPSYDAQGRNITEGAVYHTQYYGLNAMGSYASQTSIEERWLITHYVMYLKNELEGTPQQEFEEIGNLIPAVNADTEIGTGDLEQENDQNQE